MSKKNVIILSVIFLVMVMIGSLLFFNNVFMRNDTRLNNEIQLGDRECVSNSDCGSGKKCKAGKCEVDSSYSGGTECGTHSDCGSGKKCYQGKCIIPSENTSDPNACKSNVPNCDRCVSYDTSLCAVCVTGYTLKNSMCLRNGDPTATPIPTPSNTPAVTPSSNPTNTANPTPSSTNTPGATANAIPNVCCYISGSYAIVPKNACDNLGTDVSSSNPKCIVPTTSASAQPTPTPPTSQNDDFVCCHISNSYAIIKKSGCNHLGKEVPFSNPNCSGLSTPSVQPTVTTTPPPISKEEVCCDCGNTLGSALRYSKRTREECEGLSPNCSITQDYTKCGMEKPNETEYCFYKTNSLGAQIYCYGTKTVCSGFSENDIIDISKENCNASYSSKNPFSTPNGNDSGEKECKNNEDCENGWCKAVFDLAGLHYTGKNICVPFNKPVAQESSTGCCYPVSGDKYVYSDDSKSVSQCDSLGGSKDKSAEECLAQSKYCYYKNNSDGTKEYCYGTSSDCQGFSEKDLNRTKWICDDTTTQFYMYSENTTYSSSVPDDCQYVEGILVSPEASENSSNKLCQYNALDDTSKCDGSDSCYRVVEYVKEKHETNDNKNLKIAIFIALSGIIVASVVYAYVTYVRRKK